MKLNKYLLGLTLGAILVPALSQATPRKYNKCAVSVNKPAGSSVHFFSKDCRTVYIAPPKFGEMSVSSFDPAPAIQSECSIIRDAKAEAAIDQASSLKMAELRTRYIDRALELQDDLDKGIIPEGETELSIMDKIVELQAKALKIKKQNDEIFKLNYDKIDRFAGEYGAGGQYHMDNGFSQLVEKYKELNEDSGLAFTELPLDQSYLAFNEKDFDGSDKTTIGHRAVLELDVPGIGAMPVLAALGTFLDPESGTEYSGVPDGAILFNGGLASDIVFSKIGACGVLEDIGPMESFNMSDVKGKMTANAFYQYQVQVTRKYAITYNLAEFWKRVQEQGKRGGFFSRKTFNKLVDIKRSNSWITFHSESQDQRFEYTDEDIKEIKKEFIDRAIKEVMAVKTGDPKAYLSLLDPNGNNGAQEIGQQLSKCPSFYCQIGAAGFKILGAIFGSTKASSEMIQKFDKTSRETQIHDRMVTQFGTMSFK